MGDIMFDLSWGFSTFSVLAWALSQLIMSDSFETPMDCGPPGSFVHGILQARIREWVAISSSRDLPRNKTHISSLFYVFCTGM